MTHVIGHWLVVDEPGEPVLATRRDEAWAYVASSSQGDDVVIRHCGEMQRAEVPVAVIEALLTAWKARAKSVSTP